jgi:hypothetical protein
MLIYFHSKQIKQNLSKIQQLLNEVTTWHQMSYDLKKKYIQISEFGIGTLVNLYSRDLKFNNLGVVISINPNTVKIKDRFNNISEYSFVIGQDENDLNIAKLCLVPTYRKGETNYPSSIQLSFSNNIS